MTDDRNGGHHSQQTAACDGCVDTVRLARDWAKTLNTLVLVFRVIADALGLGAAKP